MSLETGPYNISSVSYTTGQPVVRPLGPKSRDDPQVVVLPLGSRAPIWSIQKISDDLYTIYLDGFNARIINGSLQLSPLRLPPFEWRILKGAPSPPPIGINNFGIIVPDQQPQQSWLIPSTEGNQAVPVPVQIGGVASSIFILPVEQY